VPCLRDAAERPRPGAKTSGIMDCLPQLDAGEQSATGSLKTQAQEGLVPIKTYWIELDTHKEHPEDSEIKADGMVREAAGIKAKATAM